MTRETLMTWDLGGAHVKLAVQKRGVIAHISQHVCPLWQGLDQLHAVLEKIHRRHPLAGGGNNMHHRITMTGELVDIFSSHADGVRQILKTFLRHVDARNVQVYGLRGWLTPALARRCPTDVASVNWHASASLAAMKLKNAVLIDIGSTTTDIIAIYNHQPVITGTTDAARLASGELVYTGVVRTPVMAVARTVRFNGVEQRIAAEHFATLADVHTLTGELATRYNQVATADGRSRSKLDCARRLGRMLGYDVKMQALPKWVALAAQISRLQQQDIHSALRQVTQNAPLAGAAKPVIVGAGAGRFLARKLARQARLRYVDFASLTAIPAKLRDAAAVCAPVVALAQLP